MFSSEYMVCNKRKSHSFWFDSFLVASSANASRNKVFLYDVSETCLEENKRKSYLRLRVIRKVMYITNFFKKKKRKCNNVKESFHCERKLKFPILVKQSTKATKVCTCTTTTENLNETLVNLLSIFGSC